MNRSVRLKANSLASEMGFSSLQELMRVVLNQLLKKELVLSIQKPHNLSNKSKLRYQQMDNDFKQGEKIEEASSVSELMSQLKNDD